MSKLELNAHMSVHNPAFARRNIIAAEIKEVIDALGSPSERSNCDKRRQRLQTSLSPGEQGFSRAEFLKKRWTASISPSGAMHLLKKSALVHTAT